MSETAFSCFNKYRFEVQKENGSRTAKAVLKVANNFDRTLVTVLIAINGINVALSYLVTMENTLIKGHLINPTGDTEVKYTEGYILVSPQQYENYFSPGDVVNLEWTYPRDYLMDSNTIWLTVKT